MRRRVLIWGGAVAAAGALAVLGVYLARVGLDEADKLASVIGLFVALAGLGAAIAGLIAEPRASGGVPHSAGGSPPDAAVTGEGGSGERGTQAGEGPRTMRQRAKATGQGRVYQAGRDQTINEQ